MRRIKRKTTEDFRNFWSSFYRETERNRLIILLSVILLFGVLVGALFCKISLTSEKGITLLADTFLKSRSDLNFWTTFAVSFEALFFVFLLLFLSGVSAAGVALIPAVMFFRGTGIGMVIGYFYSTFAVRGFFYVLILILPNVLCSSILFLILAREGIRLSARICRFFRPNMQEGAVHQIFKTYCIRSGILLIFLCISALVDSVLSVLFGTKLIR